MSGSGDTWPTCRSTYEIYLATLKYPNTSRGRKTYKKVYPGNDRFDVGLSPIMQYVLWILKG